MAEAVAKGQRWLVLPYADFFGATPQDGERYVLSGVPGFNADHRVGVDGDGVHTVAQLIDILQYRSIYAYADVSTDVPEAGAQVAITGAPGTVLYVIVVTGDGTHTVAELVANYTANLVAIASIGGVVEIDDDYTVQAGDRIIKVVGAAEIDVHIPDGLKIDTPLTFLRTVPSANKVTAVMDGDDLVEGAASFVVIGAKAAAEYDPSEVTLRKVASGDWRFVAGVVSGFAAGLGAWEKHPNGKLLQDGSVSTYNGLATGEGGWKLINMPIMSVSRISASAICSIWPGLSLTLNDAESTKQQIQVYDSGLYFGTMGDTIIYWRFIGRWK